MRHAPWRFAALSLGLTIFSACPAFSDGLELPETVSIPAGVFIMGSDRTEREAAYRLDEAAYGHAVTRENRWYEADHDRAKVTTKQYRITVSLITNGQYAVFIAATAHRAPDVSRKTWRGYGLVHPYQRTRRHAWRSRQPPPGRANHPVVLVSHDDARAYARWLSRTTRWRWRLPTEVEWERAARGDHGRRFPWGDRFHAKNLNSHDLGPFDTTEVGKFPAGTSPHGLLDAAGQVFEWTATPGKTGGGTGSGAAVPAEVARYIVKGGSWDDKGCGICRPAARHSRPRRLKHILIGFRLVREED